MKTNYLLRYSKLIFFVTLIFAPVYYFLCCIIPDKTDYTLHIKAAERLANEGIHALLPHFIFEVSLLFIHAITHLSYNISTWIIIMLFQYFAAIVIFNALSKRFQSLLTNIQLTAITISLLMVFAIPLMVFADHQVYVGYFVANVYHNPTIVILKPFAILLSLSAAGIFFKEKGNKRAILYTILLTVLSILAKPNYIMALLPALGIIALVSIFNKQYINWKLLICGIVIPSVVALAFQFTLGFILQDNTAEKSRIVFSPFTVISHTSGWLFFKFLLSIAFPLFLLIAYFKEMIRDKAMQLVWTTFITALLFVCLLAEVGPRIYHGNFLWGTQVTLFLLFFYSMIFMIQKAADGGIKNLQMLMRDKKIFYASLIYLCHFASGLLFYGSRYFYK